MTLGELIRRLEKEDPSLIVPDGFRNPHSYRGYYDELAFEPTANVSIWEMLNVARYSLGTTFKGWKGGDYKMSEWTPVHLARPGECGEELGARLLEYILAEAKRGAA